LGLLRNPYMPSRHRPRREPREAGMPNTAFERLPRIGPVRAGADEPEVELLQEQRLGPGFWREP